MLGISIDRVILQALFIAAAVVLVGSWLLARRRIPSRVVQRAGEAALLALVGGLLAQGFVGLLLAWGGNTDEVALVVGWAFLIWPGLIDTVITLFGGRPIFTPANLVWLAAVVGAVRGMFDGFWSTHDWKRWGSLGFLLDVTWGLPGTTNGCGLQLINALWATHGGEPRSGAHRYVSGFAFKRGFAVTMGSVMSNMHNRGTDSELFIHETAHVWQNRIFGPLYTFTYVGWMILLALPGAVAGMVTGAGTARGAEQWGYYNNPWEAWAYHVGSGPRSKRGDMVWSDRTVVIASIPFFAAVVGLAVWIVRTVWFAT